MLRTFGLIVVFFAVCLSYVTPVAGGSVQCTCPSVDAEGTGNTSCSASESGSKCTIDFNFFNTEHQELARDIWSRAVDGRQFDPKIDIRRWNDLFELERREPGRLLDTLMVYLLVARVQASSNVGDMQRLPRDLREIARALREENSGEVLERFSSRTFQQFRTLDPARLENQFSKGSIGDVLQANRLRVRSSQYSVVVANGCIEVRGPGLWLMYKAYWSPARILPQCATPDIWR